MKINAFTLVSDLPERIKQQILQEARHTFEVLSYPVDIQEELENVECSKMCDIECTVDVQKYYTERVK